MCLRHFRISKYFLREIYTVYSKDTMIVISRVYNLLSWAYKRLILKKSRMIYEDVIHQGVPWATEIRPE